jgi:hypothetical protein
MIAEPGDLFIERYAVSEVMIRFLLFLPDLTSDQVDAVCNDARTVAYIFVDHSTYRIVYSAASRIAMRIVFDTPKHSVSEI